MATFTPFTTLSDQLAEAVREVRKGRHHPDCHCGNFKGLWCTSAEASWCGILDGLLNKVPKRLPRQP